MTREEVENLKIEMPDEAVRRQIKENWDRVAKPLDSLGKFEEMTAQIGAALRTADIGLKKKAVVVMCADNGVVEEGVSQSGQEVTLAVAKSMGKNVSSVGIMAESAGVDVFPVDIGINFAGEIQGVENRKVVPGTANFAKEPAMTERQVLSAIGTGIELAGRLKKEGYEIIGTGEMGIGNTTTSSAVAAALLDCSVEEITGRGAGLSDSGLEKKQSVIKAAMTKYRLKEKAPLEVLRVVGGLDIAGLTGVFLGGAIYQIPVVLDGVISSVAALLAERICPGAKEYMISSHISRERAAGEILRKLELEPVLDAKLALGEGSGCVLLFSLLDVVLKLYKNRTTFADIEIEPYKRQKE